MAQREKYMERTKQFNELFLSLDNKGQDAAITVLQSLSFAQSVMCSQMSEETCNLSDRQQVENSNLIIT